MTRPRASTSTSKPAERRTCWVGVKSNRFLVGKREEGEKKMRGWLGGWRGERGGCGVRSLYSPSASARAPINALGQGDPAVTPGLCGKEREEEK